MFQMINLNFYFFFVWSQNIYFFLFFWNIKNNKVLFWVRGCDTVCDGRYVWRGQMCFCVCVFFCRFFFEVFINAKVGKRTVSDFDWFAPIMYLASVSIYDQSQATRGAEMLRIETRRDGPMATPGVLNSNNRAKSLELGFKRCDGAFKQEETKKKE